MLRALNLPSGGVFRFSWHDDDFVAGFVEGGLGYDVGPVIGVQDEIDIGDGFFGFGGQFLCHGREAFLFFCAGTGGAAVGKEVAGGDGEFENVELQEGFGDG
jgi:hypothetical protein